MWAAAALLAVALYWLQATMPALIDMLTPIYVVLGIALLVGTWKWFRWRAPRQDRRLSDRRHADRRDDEPPDPETATPEHHPMNVHSGT